MTIHTALREISDTMSATMPLPGSGDTSRRFAQLADWSSRDLSLGRLAEGHADALAILAEAEMTATDGAVYGVWAARMSAGGTTATRCEDGWLIRGDKPFCSGQGLIDRALITAESSDGYRLFDVSLADQVIGHDPDSWPAVGMADSLSFTVTIGGEPIPESHAVGPPGFYLDRPGFWFGAMGVAACWYGGARGLVEHLTQSGLTQSGELPLAELGYAIAHLEAMQSVLDDAARSIDADPEDHAGEAKSRSMVVRHAIRHGATQILGHVAAASGARPLCHDRSQGQRAADLYVYLAQHHRPQDAAELGRLALEAMS